MPEDKILLSDWSRWNDILQAQMKMFAKWTSGYCEEKEKIFPLEEMIIRGEVKSLEDYFPSREFKMTKSVRTLIPGSNKFINTTFVIIVRSCEEDLINETPQKD